MDTQFTALPDDEVNWLVVAHGRLHPSINTPDAPLVDVQLLSQGTGEQRVVQISLYDLLEMPLGSYWKSQEQVERPNQDKTVEKTFELEVMDFEEARFIQAYEKDEPAQEQAWLQAVERARRQGSVEPENKPNRYLIPPNILRVHNKCAGTQYLDTVTNCGTRLFIPCLTIFLRTYGSSKNFKNTFLDYKHEDALGRMVFVTDESKWQNRPESGDQVIGLRKEMSDLDAPFIHQFSNCAYFKRVHKSIRHQLNVQLRHGLFLKVPMWFTGPMRIKTRGVAYTTELGEERFLVHDILGLSYPELPNFFIDRENTNLTNEEESSGDGEDKPPGWTGPYGYPGKGNKGNRNSGKPPGQNAGTVRVETPVIEILGAVPQVTKAIRKEKVTQGGKKEERRGVEYDDISTSNAFSNDDRTAKGREQHQPNRPDEPEELPPRAQRHAKDVIGLLEKALKSLSASSFLRDFQFIAKAGNGYQLAPELQVLEFQSDKVWAYHGKNPKDKREIAVAKLTKADGKQLFVCEIEPRINRNGNSDGNLKGCVFLGPPSGFSGATLNRLMMSLVEHKGVWDKVPPEITGARYPYRHVGKPTEIMMVRSIKAAIWKLPGMEADKKKRGRSKKKLENVGAE